MCLQRRVVIDGRCSLMTPCRWIVLMTRLHYRLNPSFSGGDMQVEIMRLKLGAGALDLQLQLVRTSTSSCAFHRALMISRLELSVLLEANNPAKGRIFCCYVHPPLQVRFSPVWGLPKPASCGGEKNFAGGEHSPACREIGLCTAILTRAVTT